MTTPVQPDLRLVPLEAIAPGDRLRDVSDDEVARLCLSVEQQGLQNPVVVRPARGVNRKDMTRWLKGDHEGFVLVSGGHRLAAVRKLGWTAIPAMVVDPASPLEARLLEIDDNLYRHELNALDRAIFLGERKEIYEELYPNAGHGGDRRSEAAKNQTDTMSFCSDAAEKTGLTERSIRRAVRIHMGLAPDVRNRIKGTWLALKQSELLLLAGCHADQQGKIVDVMFRADAPLKSVSKARRYLGGYVDTPVSPDEKIRRRLFSGWDAAPVHVRREFLDMLEAHGFLNVREAG